MKIWTITTNDDEGVSTDVYLDEATAEIAAHEWVASYFDTAPEDWRHGFDLLQQRLGFMDSIHLQEQDLSEHPVFKALLLADKMVRVALPKFNWGASTLTNRTIKILNDAETAIKGALK